MNAALLLAGLLLAGAAAEVWLRARTPFIGRHFPSRFVPGVGFLAEPGALVRWTNEREFWTETRTNSLGFPDREPPSPEQAAAGCRVAVIGDSFVEANGVPIPDKFPARLEELARRELPALDLATSAFGRGDTGQVNQLAFYDRYVRRLRPRVVVLVFHSNDFEDNTTEHRARRRGFDPERMPYLSAAREGAGGIELRPPDPAAVDHRWARGVGLPQSWARPLRRIREAARGRSHLLALLHQRAVSLLTPRVAENRRALAGDSGAAVGGAARRRDLSDPRVFAAAAASAVLEGGRVPPSVSEAVEYTAFALSAFAARAKADGAALVLLVTQRTTLDSGPEVVEALRHLTAGLDLPLIDQYEFIRRRGGRPEDASFPDDGHWNREGHRWAAEALLAHFEAHPEACAGRSTASPAAPSSPGPAPAGPAAYRGDFRPTLPRSDAGRVRSGADAVRFAGSRGGGAPSGSADTGGRAGRLPAPRPAPRSAP